MRENFTKYLTATNDFMKNDKGGGIMSFMKTKNGAEGFTVALLIVIIINLLNLLLYGISTCVKIFTPLSLVRTILVESIMMSVLTIFLSCGISKWGWWDKEK